MTYTIEHPRVAENGAIQRGFGWWCNSCQAWVEETHKVELPVQFLMGMPVIIDNELEKTEWYIEPID